MANDLLAADLTILADGKLVIESINHRFQAGTVTLILGRSGSGKTMLLEALSGIREILHGDVFIGEAPLWKGSQSRRKLQRQTMLQLGTGFQHSEQQLFAQTVEAEFHYNLRPYRLTPEERKQRIKASSFCNSEDAEDWLKQDPFKLSGGQKRRLTLALLEAAAPEWLLLDEPTSGVDAAGVSQLCQHLKQRKASGLGSIVITHDLDRLIEAADNLLLMQAGHVIWSGSPGDLLEQPDILEAAGLVLPTSLETKRLLQQAGFNVPSGWPNAITTAEIIVNEITSSKTKVKNKRVAEDDIKKLLLNTKYSLTVETGKVQLEKAWKRKAAMKSFDPRAIWLTYILISSGILLQTSWIGWVISAFIAMGVILFTGVPYKVWSRPALGLIIFTGIAAFLSGIIIGDAETPAAISSEANGLLWQFTPNVHFAVGPAGETLFHFSRLVMIMLIGFVLLSSINHLHLKRALEQGLHGLRHVRLPIEQFALTAALMIRFLPLLRNEWDRFARIAAARGKYPVRPGRIPIRGMRMTVIPYLMSLIRLGELLSLILIIRGIGLAGRKETRTFRLTFHRTDYRLVLIAVCILIMLILVAKLA